jgi:O-antigen biosynthesis protein
VFLGMLSNYKRSIVRVLKALGVPFQRVPLPEAESSVNGQAESVSLDGRTTLQEQQNASLVERQVEGKKTVAFIASTEAGDEVASVANDHSVEGALQSAVPNEPLAQPDPETESLKQLLHDRDKKLAALYGALKEKTEEIASLGLVFAEREQQLAELPVLRQSLADQDRQIASLQTEYSRVKLSASWRVTAPLRWLYEILNPSLRAARPGFLWRQGSGHKNEKKTGHGGLLTRFTASDWSGDYVDDSEPPPGFAPDVRVVAFYLPQFHPIPENDRWWGKGFTEWANVSRALPQFEGHYQPHLPGELGFYDLRIKDVQRRQIELAKRYGVGAFCFYFYWFGGKRLLEAPLLQWLEDSTLDFPFCLCWANENWTRRWDGLNSDILIAQKHSPEDDIAFIEHVARYMRDRRYLRIDGRPVLLVYRPALLPDARATVRRWREWARKDGLGDLYIIYPQSFKVCDPAVYDFDAAAEFPPGLSDPPVLNDQIKLYNPEFSGMVYDLAALVERSRRYSTPSYKLFRGVCPSWDSEPRRPGKGSVFLRSSPDGYREWLHNAVVDTRARLQGSARLVFVNAWNEWAEGAHLEPDRRYGYAWLKATRDALLPHQTTDASPPRRVLVVTHDAQPHGAQYIALHLTRALASALRCTVEVVCLGEGQLKAEYAKYAKLHDLAHTDPCGPRARRLAAKLFQAGFRHALVNTTVSSPFLATLKEAGFRCVALVHELPEVIRGKQLLTNALNVAKYADIVVFAAPEVRDAFSEFALIDEDRAIIRPQGLFKRNKHAGMDLTVPRRALRITLKLPADASIVVAVGYADHRKGVDYFVEIAARVVEREARVHFVWVGHWDEEMRRKITHLGKRNPEPFRNIHFVGRRDDTDLYYAGADAFALTSREDPFPNVLLEAMSVGLPVVAFEGSGGGNRLINEGVGENVPMGDTNAFAAAIRRILSDAEKRNLMGQRGRALIAERFSVPHYLFELLRLAGIVLPRVSVIVPNYNYERFLPDRIATILNQTHPIYELIFLDDASLDNSVAVASDLLAGAGIDYTIVRNEVNSGSVFAQWKRGAELARGDIVWIAEADDLSDPGFLETVLAGFNDKGVVLSYCESKQIDEYGQLLGDNYHQYVADLGAEHWKLQYVNEGEDEIRGYLAVKNTIPNVSAVLTRRLDLIRVLEEHMDDIASYRVAGDWKTYLYLLQGARLAYFPQSLNLHRRHPRGLTISSFNDSHHNEIRRVQEWVQSHYVLAPRVAELAQSYLRILGEAMNRAAVLS